MMSPGTLRIHHGATEGTEQARRVPLHLAPPCLLRALRASVVNLPSAHAAGHRKGGPA